MGRKAYDGVYQGDDGIYWAYHKGKKKSVNTLSRAWDLHKEMVGAIDRAAIVRGDEDMRHLHNDEVIVLRGVPGCGKSTWAREWIATHSWYRRISKDSLREMLDFGEYSKHREEFIRKVQWRLIRDCLADGYSLVIDNTNLKDRDIREIQETAWVYSRMSSREVAIPVRVVEFDTPLEECIRRDAQRAKPVGADRITVMWWDSHSFDSDEEIVAYNAAKKRLAPLD